MAILLNILFNHFKAGNSDNQSVFVAGTDRIVSEADIKCLTEGDRFENGKLIDAEGNEVPLKTSSAS
ncbi:purine permease, partial [Burkholderia sp. SIMBA_057]